MPPNLFHDQLAGLAIEYGRLEGENHRLRSLLQDSHIWDVLQHGKADFESDESTELPCLFSVSFPFQEEEVVHSVVDVYQLEAGELVDETSAEAAEIVAPARRFQDEAMHGVAAHDVVPNALPGAPAFGPADPASEALRESSRPSVLPRVSSYSSSSKVTAVTSDGLDARRMSVSHASDSYSVSSKVTASTSDPLDSRRGSQSHSSDCNFASSPSCASIDFIPVGSMSMNSGLTDATEASTKPQKRRSTLHSIESCDTFVSHVDGGKKKSASNRKPLFANSDEMKEKVKWSLYRERYNVMDFYYDEGCCQAIARHWLFELVTLLVIGTNALWIAIDTDYNRTNSFWESHLAFQVADHFFCMYFSVEICLRFGAFENKQNCLQDSWFIFDSMLTMLGVIEVWVINFIILAIGSNSSHDLGNTSVLRIIRLLRLVRMARMARIVRVVPEILVLIKGVVAAARSVFFTLVLLCGLLYVFGILFTQLLEHDEVGKRHFYSVIKSMHTLWLYAALLDEITHLMEEMEGAGIGCVLLLDVFILISALTVMNMLIGVLCEVVGAVATSEKEELSLGLLRTKVERLFFDLHGSEAHDNAMITRDQFQLILENRQAVRAIQDLGVDVVQMVGMADVFFASDDGSGNYKDELSFAEFMDAVVQLRGSNYATVKDLVNLRNYLSKQMTSTAHRTHKKLNSVAASPRPSQSPSMSHHELAALLQGRTSSFGLGGLTAPVTPQMNQSESMKTASSLEVNLPSLNSCRSSFRSSSQPPPDRPSLIHEHSEGSGSEEHRDEEVDEQEQIEQEEDEQGEQEDAPATAAGFALQESEGMSPDTHDSEGTKPDTHESEKTADSPRMETEYLQ